MENGRERENFLFFPLLSFSVGAWRGEGVISTFAPIEKGREDE
jgi:hypothetical protein